jgi:hypothetical protein
LENKENPEANKVIKIMGYINKKSYITNICDVLSLVDGIKQIDIRE